MQTFLEKAIAENIVTPDSRKETVEAFFTPFYVPQHIVGFFSFMKKHIVLVSDGMGVSFRETRAELSSLLKLNGYDYAVVENLINDFERNLLNQYYDSQKKEGQNN